MACLGVSVEVRVTSGWIMNKFCRWRPMVYPIKEIWGGERERN